MKKSYFHLLLPLLLFGLHACQHEEETVESAYVEPLLPEPAYKFSRHGYSSVDILEPSFLKKTLDYLYGHIMREARMSIAGEYNSGLSYYNKGEFGLKPIEHVAQSPRHIAQSAVYRKDLLALIDASAALSGYPLPEPYVHRNRNAKIGRSGFVGHDIGDDNKFFIDEKGVAVAEVFKYYAMGAIYLDKVLNMHLNEELFKDAELIRRHQNVNIVKGRNYTELEHHLDLAYGYYKHWQPLTRAEGLPILKDSDHKIFIALVQARTSLQYYHYDEVLKQIAIVREELSKVVPIRIMNLLVGANTLANIEEQPEYAFDFLSQAIGLMRCLPFTLNADGKPYFTYGESQTLIADLLQGQGLWETERLLGDEKRVGSLKNIATRVGQPFNITLQNIKR